MRKVALATGLLAVGLMKTAWAADLPSSINEPPRGPGTEQKSTLAPVAGRVEPGWEVGGQMGFGNGFALGARAGYTFDRGIYAGGSFSHFWGSNVNTINGEQRTSQNFFGADLGYKIFPTKDIEIRPFVFLGAGFVHREIESTNSLKSETGFAVQPSLLGAYRFGPAFISAEVRLLLTPTPVHVGAFGGVGLVL